MRYNIKLSAERIRKNRESMKCRVSTDENGKKIVELVADQTEKEKSAPMSQGNLLRYMHQLGLDTIGRNKLSALENAEPEAFYSLTIKQWKALADVFGVSIEHITGQEPYQTPTIKALCEITGLSIPAAELLQAWKATNPEWVNHISKMLLKPETKDILIYIDGLLSFGDIKKNMNNIIEKNPVETLKNQDAQTLNELLTAIKTTREILKDEPLKAENLISRIGTKAETIAEDIYNSNR